MNGVTILDSNSTSGSLSFDLRDILDLLGPDAVRSKWRLNNVECLGNAAAKAMHHASERGEELDGVQLLALAREVDQVIDGEFAAYLPYDEDAWITIRAVDSSAYDVITEDEQVLRTLRSHFRRVEDLPS